MRRNVWREYLPREDLEDVPALLGLLVVVEGRFDVDFGPDGCVRIL